MDVLDSIVAEGMLIQSLLMALTEMHPDDIKRAAGQDLEATQEALEVARAALRKVVTTTRQATDLTD